MHAPHQPGKSRVGPWHGYTRIFHFLDHLHYPKRVGVLVPGQSFISGLPTQWRSGLCCTSNTGTRTFIITNLLVLSYHRPYGDGRNCPPISWRGCPKTICPFPFMGIGGVTKLSWDPCLTGRSLPCRQLTPRPNFWDQWSDRRVRI